MISEEMKQRITEKYKKGLDFFNCEIIFDDEIQKKDYDPVHDTGTILLGKLVFSAKEYLIGLKEFVNRHKKKAMRVCVWVILTGIPSWAFYFPNSFNSAKDICAEVVSAKSIEKRAELDNPDRRYVVCNTDWMRNQSVFDDNKKMVSQVSAVTSEMLSGAAASGVMVTPGTFFEGGVNFNDFKKIDFII